MTKILTTCAHCEMVWYWNEEEKTFYEDSETDLHRCSEEVVTDFRCEFWCGACDRFLGEYHEGKGLMVGAEIDDESTTHKGSRKTNYEFRTGKPYPTSYTAKEKHPWVIEVEEKLRAAGIKRGEEKQDG